MQVRAEPERWDDMLLLNWQNLHFAEPEKLQLLYVAAALFFISLISWLIKLFLRPKRTHGSRYPFLGTMKFWFSLSVVLPLCILAYARPFLAEKRVVFTRGNAEIVFIVDYSASMFLKDTGWARIDIAAREIMKSLSGGVIKEGDRAAILIFGKMVSPRLFLTKDLSMLATEADKIGRPTILSGNDLFWGTAIATTFKRVREIMDRQDMFVELHKESKDWRPKPKHNRLVIIFSDGDFFNYGDEEGGKERI
ncbi:MAG: VWA domain-containing protein, partial [Patescibacteria group bacterium]